jgi:UDP-N-acetylmuramate dehydrogenase
MMTYNNIPLKKYNTFGLDYMADCMIHVRTEQEAISLLRGEISRKKPLLILGSGSNILFTSDFKGTIIRPDLDGIKVEEQDHENVIISAGSGVNWDTLVEWSVNKKLGGLENLSLIPGLVGATPVQNIGAFGAEVKDKITKVKAICISDGSLRIFTNIECNFGYRNSIFKNSQKGSYLITRVYYILSVSPIFSLDYGSLKEEVNKSGSVSLRNVRQAVINIRRRKLPDPEITGNAGSFFKNPVITNSVAESLKKRYPQMPAYEGQSAGTKLAAGWLIDQCGWKGKRIGDAGVHDKQALILVNHGKASGKEIYDLSEAIKKSVLEKFGVELEREVEVVGTI